MSKRRPEDAGSTPNLTRLVLTSGEPAGIGPELCAQLAASRDLDHDCVDERFSGFHDRLQAGVGAKAGLARTGC